MRLTRLVAHTSAAAISLLVSSPAWATTPGLGLPSDVVRTALILTLLAVIPSILICMTSFVRIVVVLSMVRHAFGMPETPPNPVLVSLALFMTAFVMSPALTAVNSTAIQPLLANRIGVEEAMKKGSAPLRDFMLAQTRDADIEAIYAIAHATPPERPEQVEIMKLAPAFMLNELRVSFTIGFVILLPFLLIDLVVSAILLSLGMMMVPPATISLPIKLLMFVLIDGWSLVLQGVLGSFR
ncbi:MAG: flagellar type III secretion system pore protein FliP [Sphingomonas sp.]|jgi:flagellar biosynthetic protein FliP|uniref:flagellar type III secretion system pore protein FliP n=1 Tax=Sphingomonas sp. TaxID=28214 RepID=UPI003562358F